LWERGARLSTKRDQRAGDGSDNRGQGMSVRHHLASRSSIIFAVRVFGAGVAFIVQALIARLWGSAHLGDYLVAIAISNLLAVSLPLGFHTIGAYFAADYAARDQGRSLRRFMLRAYGHIIFPGILILIAAGFFAGQWSAAGQRLSDMWLPVCVMALATATIYVNGAVLIGLKRPYAGYFPDTFFRPIISIAGFLAILVWLGDSDRVVSLLWFLSLGYLAVALVHFAVTVRSALRVSAEEAVPDTEGRRWWHFAGPWLAISLFSDFFFDFDLLLLANSLDSEEIAIFGVCTRIFVIASFAISAVYAISVPDIMKNEAQKDVEGLRGKISEANLVAAGLSAALLVIINLVSPYVLQLFGEPFLRGVVPLGIICGVLLVRSIFGPTSIVLSARNYPYANLPAVGVGLVSLVLGNMVLVPAFGLTGAAFSAFLSFLLGSVTLWITTLRLTGLDVSIFAGLRRARYS